MAETLEGLDLDPDAYLDYAMGILDEDEEDLDARVESCIEILSGATEQELGPFSEHLKVHYSAMLESSQKQEEEQTVARAEAAIVQRERDLVEMKQKQQELAVIKEKQAAEALQRQALAAERGYIPEKEFDPEDSAGGKKKSSGSTMEEEMKISNLNHTAVNEADRAAREALRGAAAAKKKLDKDNLVKQKQEKSDTMDKRRAAAGQAGKKPSVASLKATAAKKKQNHGESNRARH